VELSHDDIYKIIIEEYIKEEGLTETPAAQDLLRRIMGDKKYCEQYPERCKPPEDGRGGDTKSMPVSRRKPPSLSSLETMPMPAEGDVESRIVNLLSDISPDEAMAIINNIVVQNYPEYEPDYPDDDSTDRTVVQGFSRRKLEEALLEILNEYDF